MSLPLMLRVMTHKLNKIEKNQAEIMCTIQRLENMVSELKEKSDDMKKNTERMESHINFVENIYDKIKLPFHYVIDKTKTMLYFTDQNPKMLV